MDTMQIDSLTARRRGYLRTGKVKVEPIRRSSDWLPEESDSAFMNTGAKIEYVAPRMSSGQILDPLGDLTSDEKKKVAMELGFKSEDDLNVNKKEKENFWINRAVFVDKNGKFLDLSNVGDFISYKILEVNLETIAPSFAGRYDLGTYKFALVFDNEEDKLKNDKIDAKKEAYMKFGKIDGSAKKMSDFLWIYYLTDKDAKRLPNNPSIDYLRGEIGRVIEERTGSFLAIMDDPDFETKVLVQKSINNGLIHRDGQSFTIFGEPTSKNSLEGLVGYLKDDRNNNIRLSMIGKLDAIEFPPVLKPDKEQVESSVKKEEPLDFIDRLSKLESISKETIEKNNVLNEKNIELVNQNETLLKQIEALTKIKKVSKGRTRKV